MSKTEDQMDLVWMGWGCTHLQPLPWCGKRCKSLHLGNAGGARTSVLLVGMRTRISLQVMGAHRYAFEEG